MKLPVFRHVYFFGYGADSEPELVTALIGRRPKVMGRAVLQDYELRIQKLHEITTSGVNPRQILANAWPQGFVSYVIVPNRGAVTVGTLYRIRLHERHKIDNWELVEEGWYNKVFVTVLLQGSNKQFSAETQVLRRGQSARHVVDGQHYNPWLMPKHTLLQRARQLA